jgi:hypothetical protein
MVMVCGQPVADSAQLAAQAHINCMLQALDLDSKYSWWPLQAWLVVACHADMLHEFLGSVQSAQSKLSALCTCVEDYVEVLLFLEQHVASEKAMDAACQQVRARVGYAHQHNAIGTWHALNGWL